MINEKIEKAIKIAKTVEDVCLIEILKEIKELVKFDEVYEVLIETVYEIYYSKRIVDIL